MGSVSHSARPKGLAQKVEFCADVFHEPDPPQIFGLHKDEVQWLVLKDEPGILNTERMTQQDSIGGIWRLGRVTEPVRGVHSHSGS